MATAVAGGDKKAPKIDGTWVVTAHTFEGKKTPDEAVAKQKQTYIFKEGKYKLLMQEKEFEAGSVSIDTSKTPWHVELKVESGAFVDEATKGERRLGLFKIDGENLTIALGRAGRNTVTRPENFQTKEGSVSVMKRQK
jgi:uncharacterized protein (TIGR03067 family)